jgi:hypothetical protein
MSPDLAFLLTLALRMAVAAAFVIAASIITERSGAAIGALVATLPVSAGPSYIFLAIDQDDAFIAQSALASLPMNAATTLMCLVVVYLARHRGLLPSLAAGIAIWFAVAVSVRAFQWTLLAGIVVNVAALGICLPLVQRFRAAKMPLITRRWFDIPLRAALVATLVAIVVTLSNTVGPRVSGAIALFPVVFTSLILILQPRIGAPATAAVLANGQWGLIGFGASIVVLHLAVLPFGRVVALSLALATCVAWNLGLWLFGRYRLANAPIKSSSRP